LRRQTAFCRNRADADGGYAAVDALVALTILTMTLGLAISAATAAARAARAADETRHAADLLQYLASAPPSAIGTREGVAGDFAWRVEVTPLATPSPQGTLHVCDRRLVVTSARTGRRYDLTGETLCQLEAAA
jgi:hypothetical protein